VYKFSKIASFSILLLLALVTVAFGQDGTGGIRFNGAFGIGLTVIGAAYGIGRLGSAALESMARQPEVAGNIQTAMIIAAALIEGFTFYAIFVCSTAAVNAAI
jgi:F-type H+-transporting ATPase subunit c